MVFILTILLVRSSPKRIAKVGKIFFFFDHTDFGQDVFLLILFNVGINVAHSSNYIITIMYASSHAFL